MAAIVGLSQAGRAGKAPRLVREAAAGRRQRAAQDRRPFALAWSAASRRSKYGVRRRWAPAVRRRPQPAARRRPHARQPRGHVSKGGASKCGGAGRAPASPSRPRPRTPARCAAPASTSSNLANNHAWDFGADGQRQTCARCARRGWRPPVGRGRSRCCALRAARAWRSSGSPPIRGRARLDKLREVARSSPLRPSAPTSSSRPPRGSRGADKTARPEGARDRLRRGPRRHARLRPRGGRRRRRPRPRVGPARHPRRRALPASPHRLLAGQLRRLGELRSERDARVERDPPGHAAAGRAAGEGQVGSRSS